MKPIIGVLTRPDHLESGNQVDVIYTNIRKAIVSFGGIPLVITPPTDITYDGKNPEEISSFQEDAFCDVLPFLKLCDGFVFQGGDQFYDYDVKILEYAKKENIPCLGICLGMQMMSCHANGGLEPIGNLFHKTREAYVHTILVNESSLLYKILGTKKVMVNSRHKEKVAYTDLCISALSPDGIIEAVEDPNQTFFLGVEWHPEDMIAYDEVTKKLWSYFLAVCKECAYENKGSDIKK